MGAEPTTLVVVDTNVLLAATDRSRDSYLAATALISGDERRLAITPQIVREYLVVATRPWEVDGFGLAGEDAVANVEQFLDDMALLTENAATTRLLLELIGQASAAGKQVHDANVIAVALAHGAAAIITDNARHFARFAGLVTIESLGAAPA